jgi:hypothetical protein
MFANGDKFYKVLRQDDDGELKSVTIHSGAQVYGDLVASSEWFEPLPGTPHMLFATKEAADKFVEGHDDREVHAVQAYGEFLFPAIVLRRPWEVSDADMKVFWANVRAGGPSGMACNVPSDGTVALWGVIRFL